MGNFDAPGPSNSCVSLRRGAFSHIFTKLQLFQKKFDLGVEAGTLFGHFWPTKPFKNDIENSTRFSDVFFQLFGPFWLQKGVSKSLTGPPAGAPNRFQNATSSFVSFLDNFWFLLALLLDILGRQSDPKASKKTLPLEHTSSRCQELAKNMARINTENNCHIPTVLRPPQSVHSTHAPHQYRQEQKLGRRCSPPGGFD